MILILSWSSSGFKLGLCSLGTHVLALYDFVPKAWAGGHREKSVKSLRVVVNMIQTPEATKMKEDARNRTN